MNQPLVPMNPKSLLCRLRRHKYDRVLHIQLALGGINWENTFAVKWCKRCGKIAQLKKGEKLWVIRIEEMTKEYWEQLDAVMKEKEK